MKEDPVSRVNDEVSEEDADEESDINENAEESPLVDEAVATANDNVHRRLNTRRMLNDARNDDAMSCTTAGSTSADSYDVIGELSINPNSVEETLLRIWDDDEQLIEVIFDKLVNFAIWFAFNAKNSSYRIK